MKLNYVSSVLFVKDIKISRQFYENFLELQLAEDYGENIAYRGGLSIWLADHAYNNIFKNLSVNPPQESSGYRHELYFDTDNIYEVFDKALKYKVNIMHEIVDQPWGQKVFRVYDPDGNIVEIGEAM